MSTVYEYCYLATTTGPMAVTTTTGPKGPRPRSCMNQGTDSRFTTDIRDLGSPVTKTDGGAGNDVCVQCFNKTPADLCG